MESVCCAMGKLPNLLIHIENLKSDPLAFGGLWFGLVFVLLMSEYFNEPDVTSRMGFPKHSAFPKLIKTVLIKLRACVYEQIRNLAESWFCRNCHLFLRNNVFGLGYVKQND